MPKKIQNRSRKKVTGAGKKNRGSSAPGVVADNQFVRDLQIRGEAKPLDSEGRLPLEATHELKQGPEVTTVERRRFKYF